MLLATRDHTAGDRAYWVVDYENWRDTADHERLVAVTATVSPSLAATVEDLGLDFDKLRVVFFVNGGVVGADFTVNLTVTTTLGQTKQDHLLFKVVAP